MDAELTPPEATWSPRDLLQYIDVCWRYRTLLLVAAILGASFALWTHIRAVPTYTGTARLLIEQPNNSLNAIDQLVQGTGRARGADPTQLQLLSSRDFVVRVLERQAEFLGLVPRAPVAAAPTQSGGPSLWVRVLTVGEAIVDKLRELVQGPPRAQLDPSILDEDLRDRALARRVATVQNTMRVAPVRNTNLVAIHWTSTDPVFAAGMANLIAEEFVEYTVETQTLVAEQASTFLGQEISSLRNEVNDAERGARALGDSLGLNPVASGANDAQTISQLTTQIASARADRIQKEATLRQIDGAVPSSVAEVRSADLVRQARAELARLETELQSQAERLTDAHPTILTLRQDVADARSRLATEEQAAYELALATATQAFRAASRYEARIQQMLDDQRGAAARLGDDYLEYQDLLSTAATKRDLLEQFLDRQESVELSSRVRGFQGATVRVVDRATLPRAPSGRQLPYRMLIAALVGGLIGAAGAIVLDFSDSTMRTAEDVSRRLGSPPIGTTTDLGSAAKSPGRPYSTGSAAAETTVGDARPELVMSQQPRSLLAEEYRELRTSLLLSTAGGAPRRVLVTSSQPSEGKTSVSVNLATSLAQTGKRVLLVDGDLRKPRMAGIFRTSGEAGLSSYLAGAAEWENCVQDTEIDNLWLLPSGPIPPNPAELYSGQRDEKFFDAAIKSFDMVICDAPPVMNVVDPLILARTVDGVLLVVRAGATHHQIVNRTRQRIADVGGKLLGIVLTQARVSAGPGYYAKKYYRQPYGGGADPTPRA